MVSVAGHVVVVGVPAEVVAVGVPADVVHPGPVVMGRYVVGLRVVVSRDHLAAAVDMGVHKYYGNGRHPDQLTVEEVRYFAVASVAAADGPGQRASEPFAWALATRGAGVLPTPAPEGAHA